MPKPIVLYHALGGTVDKINTSWVLFPGDSQPERVCHEGNIVEGTEVSYCNDFFYVIKVLAKMEDCENVAVLEFSEGRSEPEVSGKSAEPGE